MKAARAERGVGGWTRRSVVAAMSGCDGYPATSASVAGEAAMVALFVERLTVVPPRPDWMTPRTGGTRRRCRSICLSDGPASYLPITSRPTVSVCDILLFYFVYCNT